MVTIPEVRTALSAKLQENDPKNLRSIQFMTLQIGKLMLMDTKTNFEHSNFIKAILTKMLLVFKI